MPERFYITAAIDYPLGRPHIGSAFEKIGADVQARYRRMQGFETHFVVGNDEHTVLVPRAAAEAGMEPQLLADESATRNRLTWQALNISSDGFVRTTANRHRIGCHRFMERLSKAGRLYKKRYEGLYCERCEEFKAEDALVEGRCPAHPQAALTHVREEGYFFALSSFRDALLHLYRGQPSLVRPSSHRDEIIRVLEVGLEDVPVSRERMAWGIPTPFDPTQTIYVWFDALLSYITAIGYGSDEQRFKSWWPADVHVIGRDITWFHAVLWPAMLIATGLPLPRRIQVHGFLLMQGRKMTKTLGNVVDPLLLVRRFGVDALRFLLLRECDFSKDGEFSPERLARGYEQQLQRDLGGLYEATLTRYLAAVTEFSSSSLCPRAEQIFAGVDLEGTIDGVRGHMEDCAYHLALDRIWTDIVGAALRYLARAEAAQGELGPSDRRLREVVNLVEGLRVIAIVLKPFMPAVSGHIYGSFEFSMDYDSVRLEEALVSPPFQLPRLSPRAPHGAPLFPSLDLSELEKPVWP